MLYDDPYVLLAERICFNGINRSELEKLVTYKGDNGWKDFQKTFFAAAREHMGSSYEVKISGIAGQIKGIVNIIESPKESNTPSAS